MAFNGPSIFAKLASGKMTSTCWSSCQLILIADTFKGRGTPHSMHIRMPQDGRKGRTLCWRLFRVNKPRQLGYCGITLFALRRVILQAKHHAVCSPGWSYEELGWQRDSMCSLKVDSCALFRLKGLRGQRGKTGGRGEVGISFGRSRLCFSLMAPDLTHIDPWTSAANHGIRQDGWANG